MLHIQLSQFKKTTTLLVLSILLTACGNQQIKQAPPTAMPVKVSHAEQRNISISHEYTGRFDASKRVELQARVKGYLKSVNFKDGQIVKKGDVLFVIDPREFQIALDAALARYNITKKEFERVSTLRKSRSISEEDYETREQQLQIAKAELAQAKLNLDFTKIKAPFSGRVGRNLVDEGTLISDATGALATILAVNPIEFYFNASETDLLRFKRAREQGFEKTTRGAPYPVSVQLQDEDEFIHQGKINFLNNEISRDTGSIQVRAIFENDVGLLEPGMFGHLLLVNATPREVLVVPQTIIGTEQTRRFLYTVTDDNKVKRSYVELGSITKDGLQVILSGISTEERLIMGGLHRIRPGITVKPIPVEIPTNSAQQVEDVKISTSDKIKGEA